MAEQESALITAVDSDYGSDFSDGETQLIEQLFCQNSALARTIILDDDPITSGVDYYQPRATLLLPRSQPRANTLIDIEDAVINELVPHEIVLGGECAEVSRYYPGQDSTTDEGEQLSASGLRERPAYVVDENDDRPPLVRFRTPPRKGLSVTDLVSPAWCELQYFYTMKYLGRKKRTPAMKAGTSVHTKLEEQVYTRVKVNVRTVEDTWGLRIWNVVQGLRTLKNTGMTRELEVWGTVDGQLVNGVIDHLTYVCPDVDLEKSITPDAKACLPDDQSAITDFMSSNVSDKAGNIAKPKWRAKTDSVYVCDVKTRVKSGLPSRTLFDPTRYQLMLYHRLLRDLATNGMNFAPLAARYNLDADRPFSDDFLAQIGSMHTPSPESADTSELPSSQNDALSTLLAHNSLNQLWSLMLSTYREVIPRVGPVLTAEYRTQADGEIIGTKTILANDKKLDKYLSEQMQWWKGERAPKGVWAHDAAKCRSCTFVDTCEWRIARDEEFATAARAKRAAGTQSAQEPRTRDEAKLAAGVDQAMDEEPVEADHTSVAASSGQDESLTRRVFISR